MEKKVSRKKIFYIFGGVVIFLAIAFWVFTLFFLDDALTGIGIPRLIIRNAQVNDIHVFLPDRPRSSPAFRGMNVRLGDFYLDPQHPRKESLLYSKHIDFSLPKADYIISDTFYMAHISNMRGSSD